MFLIILAGTGLGYPYQTASKWFRKISVTLGDTAETEVGRKVWSPCFVFKIFVILRQHENEAETFVLDVLQTRL